MKLTRINKTYTEGSQIKKIALEDINLEFDNKGLVFILGKSGSGKTTLLNMLAGLDCPTNGEITDNGIDLTSLTVNQLNTYRKNNIGFIFQDYNLIYELSVMENILLGLKKSPEHIIQAERYLEKLELLQYKNEKVNNLSGGQQQRVAIIRALIKESKIILADEPTGNLDSTNGAIIYNVLKEISQRRLIIVVSHNQESAYQYGDRVIVLNDGEIIEDTQPQTKEKQIGIDITDRKEGIAGKTAYKLSKKFMYSRKVKLFFSAVLMAFTLSILGLLFLFILYDFNAMSVTVFDRENTHLIGVGKGYTDKETKKFIQSFRIIDEATRDELNKKSGNTTIDCRYLLQGMIITGSDTGSEYLPSKVCYAMNSSEEGLLKYGFTMESGEYPSSNKEIAITDYLAYGISVLNPTLITNRLQIDSMDSIKEDAVLTKALKNLGVKTLTELFGENWEIVIKQRDTLDKIRENPGTLLLDSEINFITNQFTVSGIIETNFETKYKDMIYMDSKDIRNDERAEDFNYMYGNLYCNFYVSNDFLTSIYKNIIVFDNCVYLKYSSWKDTFGLKTKLNGVEAYMSTNYFRKYFHEEFTSDKKDNYRMPNEVYIPLGKGMEEDIIYKNEDFRITGVFDMPSNYNNILYSNQAVIVSDEFFEEFARSQTYSSFLYMSLPKQETNQKKLLEFMKEKDLYYITVSSQSLYQLTEILKIFDNVFKAISVFVTIFALVFISNYFSGLVSGKKREIGIMRALGMSKIDVYKIFLLCGLNMLIATVVISYLLLSIFVQISNKLLVTSYLHYIDNEVINGLHILNIDPRIFIIIPIISILLLGLSVLYPICKIAKLNTINAIKEV